jgi:hypothetical protein
LFNLIMHGSQVKLYPHTVVLCTLRHRLKYIIGSTIIATMSSSDYPRMPDRAYICTLSQSATRAALVWLSHHVISCVRLRFGVWLPILRNSAQYLTIPHFLFSSSGSRAGWGDLNPQWDMIFLSPMSWLFIFLFYASRHAVNDPGLRFAQVRGIHGLEVGL